MKIIFNVSITLFCLLTGNQVNAQYNAIQYEPSYTGASIATSIDVSRPVGKTSLGSTVTESGGAVVNIPISTPTGVNNLQPELSVVYNSQAGDGVFGYGWNLAGLSAITRGPKRYYMDDKVEPIHMDDEDVYYLDGQRLVLTSGVYGADQSEYDTEMSSWDKIIATNPGGNNGITKWTFERDGGLTMEYGGGLSNGVSKLTNANGDAFLWAINDVSDCKGNALRYIYEQVDDQLLIHKIQYGSGEIEVQFEYGIRSDQNMRYAAGFNAGASKYVISEIKVTNGTLIYKRYKFAYCLVDARTMLKSVEEFGMNGLGLNLSRFQYGASQAISVTSSNKVSGNNADYHSGHFNRDGITDLLEFGTLITSGIHNPGHNVYTIYKSDPDLAGSFDSSPLTDNNVWLGSTSGTTGRVASAYGNMFNGTSTTDFNGDGLNDFIYTAYNVVGSNNIVTEFVTHFSPIANFAGQDRLNKQAYSPPSYYNHVPPATVNGNYSHIQLGDVNGDAKTDFIAILYDGSVLSNAYLNLSGGINQADRNIPIVFSFAGMNGALSNADHLALIDFNGDGDAELWVNGSNITPNNIVFDLEIDPNNSNQWLATPIYSAVLPLSSYEIFPGDYNGDGITDFIVQSNSQNNAVEWGVMYGTGTYFHLPTNSGLGVGGSGLGVVNPSINDHTVGDFNADGLADILWREKITTGGGVNTLYIIAYSKGNSFQTELITANGPALEKRLVMGDFNGDGRVDMLNRYNTSQDPQDFITFRGNGTERQLLQVMDGFNNSTTFDYKPLSYGSTSNGDDFYDVGNPQLTYPYLRLNGGFYAVIKHGVSDGLDGQVYTSYEYDGLKANLQGKGLIGFEKITVRNNLDNNYIVKNFELNQTYSFQFLNETEGYVDGNLVSQTTAQINVINVSSSPDHFSYSPSTTTSTNYINNSKTTVESQYLGGLFIQSTSYIGYPLLGNLNDYIEKVWVVNEGYHNACNGQVGHVKEVITQTIRAGEPMFEEKVHFDYHVNNGVIKRYDFYQTAKQLETSYGDFDTYGNAKLVTVVGPNVAARTTSFKYNNTGRLVTEITNPLNQTESFTYHTISDNVLSHTSIEGLVTNFQYDDFGRNILTTYPDNTSTATQFFWDVQSGSGGCTTCVDNAVYYVKTTSSSTPDAEVFYDRQGKPRLSRSKIMGGDWVNNVTSYNVRGEVKTTTGPFTIASNAVVNTNHYDVYRRTIEIVRSSGGNNVSTDITYTSLSQGVKVKVDPDGSASVKKYIDAAGKLTKVEDGGGTLHFKYGSHGNRREVKNGTQLVNTMTFDDRGYQTELWDISAGTVAYDYNTYGELIHKGQEGGINRHYSYDLLGRMWYEIGPEGNTEYQFVTLGNGLNKLKSILGFNNKVINYNYDNLSRLSSIEYLGDQVREDYSYTNDGLLDTRELTVGSAQDKIAFDYDYDSHGFLNEIKVSENNGQIVTSIWQALEMNAFHKDTEYIQGNNVLSTHEYNNFGMPVHYDAGNEQDLEMLWDINNGNLVQRYDGNLGTTEDFDYDNMNRLIESELTNQNGTMTYNVLFTLDGKGNIETKHDVGTLAYDNNDYRVTSAVNTSNVISTAPQTVTSFNGSLEYNGFDEPEKIVDDIYTYEYDYGADFERLELNISENNAIIQTRNYYPQVGYETLYDLDQNSATFGKKFHTFYEFVGGKTIAIVVKESSGSTAWTTTAGNGFHYTYTDHLGSILKVTDANGSLVSEQSFDAWGRKRNAQFWDYSTYTGNYAPLIWMTRGYTTHEHLDHLGLIHMNGRLYDPVLGRMLSPDNFVQNESSTQSYNRYSYVLNNPLKYIDLSGEFINGFSSGNFYSNMLGFNNNNGTQPANKAAQNIGFPDFQALAIYAYKAQAIMTVAVTAGILTGGAASAGLATTTGVSGGVIGGAVSGAASGFASGFVTGYAGSSFIWGNDVNSSLAYGWQYGKMSVSTGGSVPTGETITISKQNGMIMNRGGGWYSPPTDISVYNADYLHIQMTGSPTFITDSPGIYVRPPYTTRVLIYVP